MKNEQSLTDIARQLVSLAEDTEGDDAAQLAKVGRMVLDAERVYWSKIGDNSWQSEPMADGYYATVAKVVASDGVTEYWFQTCLRGFPAGPLKNAEISMSLDDAQENAEAALRTVRDQRVKALPPGSPKP